MPESTKKALDFYQRAIEEDPTYALAYAGIADCYALLGFTPYGTMRPTEAFPRAKAAARKALALDDSLGEAHASTGLCAFWYDWEWTAAEHAFRRALEINPQDGSGYIWYSSLLAVLQRPDEAIQMATRAIEIDPLSVNAAAQLTFLLYHARRYDEAIVSARKPMELDPNYPSTYVYASLAHLARGEFTQAIELTQKAASLTRHPHWTAHVGWMCGLAGRRDDAARILLELTDAATHAYVSPFSFSIVYDGLGDIENWTRMMHACLDERNSLLVWLDAPWNDSVRHLPFFAELRSKVGLPRRDELLRRDGISG